MLTQLVCVFPMSLCVACFEDFQFSLTGGHSTGWTFPSSRKEIIPCRVCVVFHFIIVMQKIYYIRVVLFVVGFARVLAKVQNFKMKKEKHNIICVCEMLVSFFFRETAADTKRELAARSSSLSFLLLYHRHVKRNYASLVGKIV